MRQVAFRSAAELAAAIRRKEVSSRELVEHYLARIQRFNSQVNAVVTLDPDGVLARADAADAALARGDIAGPLHGVPITIKDTIETAGMRTTAGAQLYAKHIPGHDAPAVARLVAAGAVIMGKTNTPRFAMDVQTYNSLFGTTNNPWDLARTPGGSSGGAAAALAAGLTTLELGSDIGGSIRTPAHFCGVYGHKPTHGIVPTRGHIPGPPGTLSDMDIAVLGPLARSAEDLALALDVVAGPDDDRAVAWKLQLPVPRCQSLREYRVAAWLDEPVCAVDAEICDRLQATVDALRRAGVQVHEDARPGFGFGRARAKYEQLLWAATCAGLPTEMFRELISTADTLAADDGLLARFARATTQRHREWLSANESRQQHRARWAEFFRHYDVLLCPVAVTAAILHDHSEPFLARTIQVNGQTRSYADLLGWAGLIGMALLPSTVAPVGRTAGGLPVGVQIVGPYLEDRTPLDFARRLAEVTGGFEIPPGYESVTTG